MSNNLKEYVFNVKPTEITYLDKDPLELNSDLIFFHNKIKFRKEITQLQNLFKEYTKTALQASGIRDSYLKEEFSENFYLIIFTTHDIVKKTNEIIEPRSHFDLKVGCYYLESTSEYMLLLAKDLDGVKSGVNTMEDIFYQTFEEYYAQKNTDDYVKIRSFKLFNCTE
ncbi:MAG: hypothetical protein ACTSQL_01155 [Promethearchaeota archaeon]